MTESHLIRRSVTLALSNGLHMVPCSEIAKLAGASAAVVRILGNDVTVDAKSVLDLLQLKAEFGTILVVEAEGEGSQTVVDEIARLFETNFEPARTPPDPASTDTALP